MWPHFVRCPALGFPAVEIAALSSCVHHEVDGTASTKCTSTWYNRLSVRKLRCLVALVEQSCLCCGLKVLEVENRVDDVWYIFVVGALLDHKNA